MNFSARIHHFSWQDVPVIIKFDKAILSLQHQATKISKHVNYKEVIQMSNNNSSGNNNKINVPEARAAMEQFKFEVANEIGVPLKKGYNGDLTSAQNGYVGGYMVKNNWPERLASFSSFFPFSYAFFRNSPVFSTIFNFIVQSSDLPTVSTYILSIRRLISPCVNSSGIIPWHFFNSFCKR